MALLWRLARVLWVILVTGCMAPAEFSVPLGEPGAVKIDQRLGGTWYGILTCAQTEGDFQFCGRVGPPAALLTLNIAPDPRGQNVTIMATVLALDASTLILNEETGHISGRVLQLRATAYPTSINGVTYYNIRRHAGVGYDYTGIGKIPHFIIGQVEVEGENTLYLRFLDPVLDLPFDIHKKRRRVDWPTSSSYYWYDLIDAPREQLIDWLRKADRDVLFPVRIGPFHRLAARLDLSGPETVMCEPDEDRRTPRYIALGKAAGTLARFGLARQAREAAKKALEMDSLGVSRDWQSGDMLGKIISTLAITGDQEAARAALENALKKHRTDPPESVICAQARLGPIPDAIRLAKRLADDYERNKALNCIAMVQAETGDSSGALETVPTTGKVYLMRSVAHALAEAGNTAAALELLKDAATISTHPHELEGIARAMAASGDVDAAAKTLRRAASLTPAGDRLAIAELQVEVKDMEGAMATFEPALTQIRTADIKLWPGHPGFDKWRESPRIIALQVRLEDRAGASQTLDKLIAFVNEQRHHLGEPLGHYLVAMGNAAIGNGPAALSEAESLGSYSLYEIADVQYMAGDTAGAAQTLKLAVRKMQAEIQKAQFSLSVSSLNPMDRARVHLNASDKDAAAFYVALATENGLRQADRRVESLLEVAEGQWDLGDVGGARSTALYAWAIAQEMPLMAPCSGELFQLLTLPELDVKPKQ